MVGLVLSFALLGIAVWRVGRQSCDTSRGGPAHDDVVVDDPDRVPDDRQVAQSGVRAP